MRLGRLKSRSYRNSNKQMIEILLIITINQTYNSLSIVSRIRFPIYDSHGPINIGRFYFNTWSSIL